LGSECGEEKVECEAKFTHAFLFFVLVNIEKWWTHFNDSIFLPLDGYLSDENLL
jgi:hypothetical protein